MEGKTWICGDFTTVYQIIPESHWTMKELDPDAMSKWVFCEYDEIGNKPGEFVRQGYVIVVAGKMFGCGSKTVEHPTHALKGAGVKLVVAESFSRYSYRNALNLALPVMICPGITDIVARGDLLEVDRQSGIIINKTSGVKIQAEPIPPFGEELINNGGLLGYIRRKGV